MAIKVCKIQMHILQVIIMELFTNFDDKNLSHKSNMVWYLHLYAMKNTKRKFFIFFNFKQYYGF